MGQLIVEIKDNLNYEPRPDGANVPLVVHRYSNIVLGVIKRAMALADEHGHSMVRVEHFITAIFAEPEARARVERLGYTDESDEVRRARLGRFAFPGDTSKREPSTVFNPSRRLSAWFSAALENVQQREPEHLTLIIDDFFWTSRDGLDPPTDELRSVQFVLKQYKRNRTQSFQQIAIERLGQIDSILTAGRTDARRGIGTVSSKVDRISTDLRGVVSTAAKIELVTLVLHKQLEIEREQTGSQYLSLHGRSKTINEDTTKITADTAILKSGIANLTTLLPTELGFTRSLYGMVLSFGVITGSCVGLVARWQLGSF